MISLDKLSLHRYYFFQDAEFTFEKGITRIDGDNGSGKSLMFSAIPTMLSLIHEKDDVEKPPISSKLDLSFHNNKTLIDYNVTTSKSAKYSIALNGANMQPHKKVDAQAILARNWTIPQALFQSTVFLRGTDRHPLSLGTPGTRSHWLSQALNLTSVYDALKVEVDIKLDELKTAFNNITVLQEELNHVQSRLPESSISKRAAEKAEILLKKHRKILRSNPNKISTMETALRAIQNILELPRVEGNLQDLQDQLDTARMKVAKLASQAEHIEELREIKESNAAIKQQIVSLKTKGLNKSLNLDIAKDKFAKQLRTVENYQAKLKAYQDQTDDRMKWMAIETLKPQTRSQEEAENLLSALVYRGTMQQDTLENLGSLDKKAKVCPTCGNELTKNHISHEMIRLSKELKVLPSEITRLKLEVRYWKMKQIKFLAKPEKPKFTSKEHEALETQIQLVERYQKLKSQLQKEQEIPEDVEDRLEKMRAKVKKLDKSRMLMINLSAYQGMLPEEYKDYRRDQLEQLQEVLDDEISKLKTIRQRSGDIIDKYSAISMRYDTQKKLQQQHRATVSRLSDQIANYKDETKDYEAWKALNAAYGNSGVRLFYLKESAAILSTKLTELSALFFNSTYNFDIEVAPHKLTVNVERKGKIGAVKTLSGAESRSWNLLCAMALIRILPSSMRCDTMILDEIEANMNKRSRDRYVRDVLPELQSIVPKIVLISPLMDGELNLSPDRHFTVVNNRVDGQYVSKLIAH